MVLQRWQSVFLFLVAVMMACFTFLSLGQVQMPDYTLDFSTMGFEIENDSTEAAAAGYYMNTWPFFIISILCTVLPLIAIFLFRNMKLQKTVCAIEALLLVALAVVGLAYGYANAALQGYQVSWSLSIIMLPLALLADILAYRRITADQKLLRAADRLR